MLFELCTLASIRKLRSAQKPAKPHAMRFRKPRRRKTCHRTWVAKWISTLGTCCQKHTHDGQMILKWKTFGRRFKRGKELKQTKGFRTSRLAFAAGTPKKPRTRWKRQTRTRRVRPLAWTPRSRRTSGKPRPKPMRHGEHGGNDEMI